MHKAYLAVQIRVVAAAIKIRVVAAAVRICVVVAAVRIRVVAPFVCVEERRRVLAGISKWLAGGGEGRRGWLTWGPRLLGGRLAGWESSWWDKWTPQLFFCFFGKIAT
jgi:hypothetical protein